MERFVVCRSHARAGDDRVVRKVLSQIVLAAGLVLAADLADRATFAAACRGG